MIITCHHFVEFICGTTMRKRILSVDWKAIDGAAVRKRILHLREDDDKSYVCPIANCLHDGYRSSRGLRKHIDSCHAWFRFFDKEPRISRQQAFRLPKPKLKSCTKNMPAFSLESGIGKDFLEWMQTQCGGGKLMKDAIQTGRRAMKFLMHALGEPSIETVLQEEYVDCCIGSPSIIIRFMKAITEEWDVGSSGALNYLKAVADLMDFRKANGVSDNILRTFVASEVYIRRGLSNLGKQKKIDYARNLDVESLIARNSWATMEEMEQVVPYHMPKFEHLVKRISCNEDITINDLAFTTRFIVTFLFLRVKCTRPMTYKFLTVRMLEVAKNNGGYVDATLFKTVSKYGFDTLILSKDVMAILDTYVNVFRPRMHPVCDYVLVTTNGKPYTALGAAMSLLVLQSIDKVVNPTRYRQIVESESSERLTQAEQHIISKDQKHSSQVAKRIYQKQLSRDVAKDGVSCMSKLVGEDREEQNSEFANSLTAIQDVNSTIQVESDQEDGAGTCVETLDPVDIDALVDLIECDETIEGTTVTTSVSTALPTPIATYDVSLTIPPPIVSAAIATTVNSVVSQVERNQMDVEIKKEEVQNQVDGDKKLMRFTSKEDSFLRDGIGKYGFGQWSKILKDNAYPFHTSRDRDSLRIRARTLKIKAKRKVGERQCKNV